MGPGDNRRAGSAGGLALPGREDGGQPAAEAAGPDGLGAAAVTISRGRGPGGPGALAGGGGPRRGRGWTAGNRPDGPPHPDPPRLPRLGADPGTVGDTGDARVPGAGPSPGHAGDTRDVPGARDP